MVKPENQLILSLTDFVAAIKRQRLALILTSLGFMLLVCHYFLSKPLTYEAKGSLKTKSKEGSGLGAKLLGLAELQSTYAEDDSPMLFLSSVPVAERVVKKLSLNGHIVEIGGKKTRPAWYLSLLALKAQNHFARRSSLTQFGRVKPSPSADLLPFEQTECPISFKRLIYPLETTSELKLHFLDDEHFELANGATGKLGTPLTRDGFTLTLSSAEPHLKGRKFVLYLSPVALAAETIGRSVKVAIDKENAQIVHVRVKHPSARVAQQTLNCFIDEYIHYLAAQGMEKINHQLSYLAQREEDVIAKLRTLTKAQAAFASKELERNNFSLLGDPKSAGLVYQAACKRYSELSLEVQSIYESIFAVHRPVEEIIHHVSEMMENDPALSGRTNPMTRKAGETMLVKINQQIEDYELQFQDYTNLCNLLNQEDFHLYTLTPKLQGLLMDGELTRLSRFVAGPNHTTAEREFAKEQLNHEKRVIQERLRPLHEQQEVELKALKERTQHVQKQLLAALLKELQIVQEDIGHYLVRCGKHADQALFEHNAFLNKEVLTKFQGELLKMAEAKNLAFHLETISTKPFQKATLPILPKAPKLFVLACFGSFLGGFIALCFLILKEVYLGPTASAQNLRALGRRVVNQDELVIELKKCSALMLHDWSQADAIAKKCSQSKKRCLLFSLHGEKNSCLEKLDIQRRGVYDELELGKIEDRALLLSADFFRLLNSLKQDYDLILIAGTLEYKHYLIQIAEQLFIVVNNERLSIFGDLPEESLFYPFQIQPLKKKSLKDALFAFDLKPSFSSSSLPTGNSSKSPNSSS